MTISSTALKAHRKTKRLRYDKIFGLLLISPWILGLVLFKFVPILASLGISFTDFLMLSPGEAQFVGLDNYVRLFRDRAVGYTLFDTLSQAMTTVPFQIAASIILAALLNSKRLKGRTILRTLFFFPSIIPSVAVLFMWFGFVDPSTGWLNRLILEPLGLTGFNNVYSDGAISLLFAINSLWSIGPGMLIMLGAMQGISPEVIEASRVDGAGPFVRFFSIVLPLISPAIFFAIIINLITVFGGVVLLDRGNNFSGSISSYDGYISNMMFREFDLGYASSLAWILFIIVMIIIAGLFGSARRWVYYPDQEKK